MQESTGDSTHEVDALLDSSEEDNEEDLLAFLENCDGSDEAAQRLKSEESRLALQLERMESKYMKLERLEKALEQKEHDCLGQMDSSVDTDLKKEQDLSSRIEQLHTENLNLREITESRANENKQLADRLSDTTRQCTESETRVQFLVDRIVALLSASSTDQMQTDALLQMRDKERNMLKQLEDCRAQFDEVRQQNSELTSRLTEEQQLSRRLQEQLAEVEDRLFNHMQRCNGVNGHSRNQPGDDNGRGGAARSPPLVSRPLGADPTDLPGSGRADRQLADLPRPIPEGDENVSPRLADVAPALPSMEDRQRESAPPALGAVLEGPETPSHEAADEDSRESLEREGDAQDAVASQDVPVTTSPREGSASSLQAQDMEPPAATGEAAINLMEHKLRAALDHASFECPVVREKEGIYKFGHTTAEVRITPQGDVLAKVAGRPFELIDGFISNIAEENRRLNAGEAQEVRTAPSESTEGQPTEAPAAVAANPYPPPLTLRTASAGPTFPQPQTLTQPLSARGRGACSSPSRIGQSAEMGLGRTALSPSRLTTPGGADLSSGSGMLPVRTGIRAAPSMVNPPAQGDRIQTPRLAGQGPAIPHLTAGQPMPGPGPPASNRQGVISTYPSPGAATTPRQVVGLSPGRRWSQGTGSAVGAPLHYTSSA